MVKIWFILKNVKNIVNLLQRSRNFDFPIFSSKILFLLFSYSIYPKMFENYKKQYEQLWKMFIRPYRQIYYLFDLGPKSRLLHGKFIKRHDMDLKNDRNLTLKCSYFEYFPSKSAYDARPDPDPLCWKPCVIYLHCNATSRIEALELLPYLVECDIHLFCFDFSGCGLSEGEYVSLGVFEAQDLKCVVEYVRKNYGIRHIGFFFFFFFVKTKLVSK